MNIIIAASPRMIEPTKTSVGNIGTKFLSSIIGINKIAPAGGKLIFILFKVINNIMQEIAVQIDRG